MTSSATTWDDTSSKIVSGALMQNLCWQKQRRCDVGGWVQHLLKVAAGIAKLIRGNINNDVDICLRYLTGDLVVRLHAEQHLQPLQVCTLLPSHMHRLRKCPNQQNQWCRKIEWACYKPHGRQGSCKGACWRQKFRCWGHESSLAHMSSSGPCRAQLQGIHRRICSPSS